MKREYRLVDNDMLSDKHFPIRAVFNSISDASFVETISSLTEGVGFGVEYGACIFPSDLDEFEIAARGTFDGVEFGLHNGEEVVVDYQTFYYYLTKVCGCYIEDIPWDKDKIEKILEKVKKRFNLQ